MVPDAPTTLYRPEAIRQALDSPTVGHASPSATAQVAPPSCRTERPISQLVLRTFVQSFASLRVTRALPHVERLITIALDQLLYNVRHGGGDLSVARICSDVGPMCRYVLQARTP